MIESENYVSIQGWMITMLGLKDKELIAYALIYGFCQVSKNPCICGYKYISEWLGCCEKTAYSVVKSLEEKGLVTHTQTEKDGKTLNTYYIVKGEPKEIEKQKAEKKEKKTRVPLIDREPVNDIEKVEKCYLLNYRKLYEMKKVSTENPVVNWQKAVVLLKGVIESVGVENAIKGLDAGIKDDWVVSTGYSLTTVLSAGVLNRLLNSNTTGVGVGSGVDSINSDESFIF